MDCIFCKIIAGHIPAEKLYEDDLMVIIKEIAPQAKLHYLMFLKEHFANILEMTNNQAENLGKCIKKIGELSDILGLRDGFRLVSNKGLNACQSVEHLHIHILGGEKLSEKIVY